MVGGDGSSATPKKTAPEVSISPVSAKNTASTMRNGKHVKSEEMVRSDESGEESEESRFTDSEDDR